MPVTAALNQNNLGPRVTARDYSWLDLVTRAWGDQFYATDPRIYEFSNGRATESTDIGSTGIYNGGADT